MFKKKETTKTYPTTLQNDNEGDVFVVVEKMPEFPGGPDGLSNFLTKNIKYPSKALKKGVEGKVYAQFIVEKDGSVSDIKIIRGIGSGCDEETIRVIKLMPNWTPGAQRGKPVRVRFVLPVAYLLTTKKD